MLVRIGPGARLVARERTAEDCPSTLGAAEDAQDIGDAPGGEVMAALVTGSR